MIGGAAANVVDRARDGVVTDYLHTGWWPTFNLADSFLVTGSIAIAMLHARPAGTAADNAGVPIRGRPVSGARTPDLGSPQ